MDKLAEEKPKKGANAPPPRKGKIKTFLIGKELKTKDLRHTKPRRKLEKPDPCHSNAELGQG